MYNAHSHRTDKLHQLTTLNKTKQYFSSDINVLVLVTHVNCHLFRQRS